MQNEHSQYNSHKTINKIKALVRFLSFQMSVQPSGGFLKGGDSMSEEKRLLENILKLFETQQCINKMVEKDLRALTEKLKLLEKKVYNEKHRTNPRQLEDSRC